MSPHEIESCARMLFEAERSGVQMGLISQAYPNITLDEAYAIQSALVAHKCAEGERRIGWKIGLTSRAMQEALQITTPDSGVLFKNMQFAHCMTVPAGRFIQPRIEAEIAFEIASDLSGTETTRDDVLAATRFVRPALEILDTRIKRRDEATGRPRKVTDTIADNAANAGLVLGPAQHRPQDVDLRWAGVILKRDGVVEETGLGAGVLDDPATGVVWLVQRLARYGLGLSAGDIVLSGSFIRPVEAPPGSHFHADFGAFGQVEISFA